MQLIITEKPRAALRIANALADSSLKKKSISGVPYYELMRDGKKIVVVSAVGHLFGIAEKEKSNSYPVKELEWKPKEGFAKKYASAIKKLAKNAKEFIVACDYDIEGEIIGLNVLRFLCKQQDAKRMKFSTLTKQELNDSYKNKEKSINWGQAIAGETRHYLDFMYGISLSRALMHAIKKGGVFKKLSIGRVQGPALAILVRREKEIKGFKPTPYWKVSLLVEDEKGNRISVMFSKNVVNKEKLDEFKNLEGEYAEALTFKEESRWLPLPPFDLTTLQTEAYKFFGLTPSQVLQIAQTLYLEGLISYPRTSSQKLPFAIGYRKIIEKLSKLYPQLTKNLTRKKPVEGKKSDPAHPSIFPTGEKPKHLGDAEKSVYELILRRFLACFAEDAIVENKKIVVKIGNKEFYTKGLKVKRSGWLDIYKLRVDEKALKDFGGKVKIVGVNIEEKLTQPPKRYTPASIVSELTKKNLGTKGTRAMIIDTLYQRGYIKDRSIVVTDLGLTVNNVLEKYSPLILDEKLTRDFEEKMEKLQAEHRREVLEKKQKETLKEAAKVLEKIAEQIRRNEEKIGKELVKSYRNEMKKEREERVLGKCECGGTLIIRTSKKTKKRFVACTNYPKCEITFPLPQKGKIKKSGDKCKKCGRQLITIIRRFRKPWTFCFAGCNA